MTQIYDEHQYYELVSWSELDIGDIYIHIHNKDFSVKTGPQSYFTFDNRSFHYWPKLLQEHDYKNFVKCSFWICCSADLEEKLKEWRKQF